MPNGSPISSAIPRPLRDPTIGQILADQRFDERRRQARFLDRVRHARQEFFFGLDCCQEFLVQRGGGRGGHRFPFDVDEAKFSEEFYLTPRRQAGQTPAPHPHPTDRVPILSLS